MSYLTSSPPKWVPKTRREIVCTQLCTQNQDQARLPICNRDRDCDSSSSRVDSAPPARFHAAVWFSLLLLLFGWPRSWQGEESGVRQTFKRALGSRYSISAPLPVWRDIDY